MSTSPTPAKRPAKAGSKRLGRAIQNHRLVVLGLTLDQAAKQLDTSKTSVGRWEDAIVLPEPKAVPTVRKWLGITVSDMGALLRDEPPPDDPDVRLRLERVEGGLERLRADLTELTTTLAGKGAASGQPAAPPPGPRPSSATGSGRARS